MEIIAKLALYIARDSYAPYILSQLSAMNLDWIESAVECLKQNIDDSLLNFIFFMKD